MSVGVSGLLWRCWLVYCYRCRLSCDARKLPRDAARFLVDYGNKLNADATVTTVLQVWRSTSLVEASWERTATARSRRPVSVVSLIAPQCVFHGSWLRNSLMYVDTTLDCGCEHGGTFIHIVHVGL
jgi:hypothetical protein